MGWNMENGFTGLSDKNTDLIILILASQNIEFRVEQNHQLFNILVNEADMENARSMVETYYRENKFFRITPHIQQLPISTFKSYPAFVIMGLLWLLHAACIHYQVHENMILKFGASALFILQGEIYRAVTALFLHSDARHLAGNMAGILIFGAPFISLAGFGVGPFMLLFAGTLGNLFNALLYKNAHLSIGASTAVMAAAGFLVAFQVIKRPIKLDNLMPVFAGALIVGMLSQGERTDVMAHVFGFLNGLGSGMIFFPLNQMLVFPQKDTVALLLTLMIIALSLFSAI